MSGGIANLTIEEQLQQICSKVLDEIRIFYELLINQELNVNPLQVYSKISSVKDDVEVTKYKLGEYIIRVREAIQDGDLYLEILNNLEKSAQNIDAAGYRYSVILSRGNKMDDVTYRLLVVMAEKLMATITQLSESIRLLSVNPNKSLESSKAVVRMEEDVDELYRSFELKLYEKSGNDLVYIMLAKDVADRLEDSEDLLKVSSDTVTYLALERS
ncbi:phosphate transport regulator [Sulfuracidifex metallicus]|uniref:phosphate transport regulator n=1 Tax=Sulfuracidifex metallicus TaxID=47303 RepID=UPI002276D23E|nr:phosphate transport regulator [Sulfuracidifex metallicus]MCY0850569.1 phosphate transport regulator [Sulfuracidifex metallicus]